MFKYIGGACAVVLLCGAVLMAAGCGEVNANMLGGKKSFVVGKDIAAPEIKDFYYTLDSSTNPPEFQRYKFSNKDGKYSFYHEKREGDTWPLKEKHITVSGTVALTDKQWQEFIGYIKGGKVTKRAEETASGGRGPWLFLYWAKDKGVYQVYEFADVKQKEGFEQLCLALKQQKNN